MGVISWPAMFVCYSWLLRLALPLLVAAALQLMAPRSVWANGNNTHIWISLRAVEHLPPGALKDLLADPDYETMLLNGTMFPDGGYVVGDDYGEMAHWEDLHDAYREWIMEEFGKPYDSGQAASHTAFLFGLVSHGMADQVYDSQFMAIAKVRDADGWADGLLDGFDTATDVMLVSSTGQDIRFDRFVPAEELSKIYADRFDYDVDPSLLLSAQDSLHDLVLNYPREVGNNDPVRVEEYREQYPWASDNLMDPFVQGSPPCEAVVVAAHWQATWFRMHEEQGPDLVVATVPGDGGRGQPVDSSLVESQLIVVFAEGMDTDTVNRDTVTVTSADGDRHEVGFRFHYGDDTNVLRMRPEADWAQDMEYTVTLKPGIRTSTGATLSEPLSFRFSTAPRTDDSVPPCTDPTSYASEPGSPDSAEEGDEMKASDEGCGCSASGESGAPLVSGALLMLFGLWRRGRTRTLH